MRLYEEPSQAGKNRMETNLIYYCGLEAKALKTSMSNKVELSNINIPMIREDYFKPLFGIQEAFILAKSFWTIS